jgi:hypothetical protein
MERPVRQMVRFAGALAAALGASIYVGCDDEIACQTKPVTACADSLAAPDSAAIGASFLITVSGVVGATLCYAFGRTEVRWVSQDHVELRPRGTVSICKGTTCPAEPRSFSDRIMITPQVPGWLLIEVISDCTSLLDSVMVTAVKPGS